MIKTETHSSVLDSLLERLSARHLVLL